MALDKELIDNNNSLYLNTPFDGPTFKAVINRFTTAAAATVHDGGKAAIEENGGGVRFTDASKTGGTIHRCCSAASLKNCPAAR